MKAATSVPVCVNGQYAISIHAAREGGDTRHYKSSPLPLISIHAAREGGDAFRVLYNYLLPIFQSTPPVKAATNKDNSVDQIGCISIHAAREGGDYNTFRL